MDAPRIRDWPGPLDVGGLAADAVELARAAVERLARVRGSDVEVGTSAPLIVGAFDSIGHLRIDGRPAEGWAPLSGFVEAGDGWVRLHGNFPHHAQAICTSLQVDGPEDLARAVARLPCAEVEERVTAAGGIATVVRTPEQWQAHPHHLATREDPWHRTVEGESRPELGPATGGPLTGVKVLDLTRVIAGPVCSELLACLGADVLRIDPPHRPELLDHYLAHGMGKRSVERDLGTHQDLLHEALLSEADVVLLGYRPGSLSKLGLDPEALAERHPHLVVGSLSAWGEHGPWGTRAGFDSIVQAATGIATVYGGADVGGRTDAHTSRTGRPGALPVQGLDHSSGFVLAAGVLDLLAAARVGRVHVSLLGAARELLDQGVREPESRPADGADTTTVYLDTPHGPVRTVPVPITLDGRPLTAPIRGYTAADAQWLGTNPGARSRPVGG